MFSTWQIISLVIVVGVLVALPKLITKWGQKK